MILWVEERFAVGTVRDNGEHGVPCSILILRVSCYKFEVISGQIYGWACDSGRMLASHSQEMGFYPSIVLEKKKS